MLARSISKVARAYGGGWESRIPYGCPPMPDPHPHEHEPHASKATIEAYEKLSELIDSLPKRKYNLVVEEFLSRFEAKSK